MKVLVTGGAGYIGTHTLLELMQAGHEVCVLDNFSNSCPEALERVKTLSNQEFSFHRADIRAEDRLNEIMERFRPEGVIHFAGLKAVGESEEIPLEYYDVNVSGTLKLLRAMDRVGCKNLIFSSSATVYGDADYLPYDENHRCVPANVYGRTKYLAEQIIRDWQSARPEAAAVLLRYFNPVGAHVSGRIGEDPADIPNNLMPFIAQVAVGRREKLQVFGNDYDTPDGTGVRDYIHVVDLARAHCDALKFAAQNPGAEAINIGTGQGYSVMDIISAYQRASGQKIDYEVTQRRAGDIAQSVANPERAQSLLGWHAELGLDEICASSWKWQSENPNGYK